ncbi:MAG: transposase [bacterium]
MSRCPRLMIADGTYHVRARGNNGEDLFRDDADRIEYLELVTEAKDLLAFHIFAYVLMTNHIHIAVRTPQPNIGEIMHRIHRPYAFRFNRRYNRTGHVFGGPYRSRLILDDDDLLGVTRYIHRNPVRAGLTLTAGDYRWSSYQDYVSPMGPTLTDADPVLTLIGKDASKSRATYAAFVAVEA